MTIISYKQEREKDQIIICSLCDSILQYDYKDVKYEKKSSKHYVKCPVCGMKDYLRWWYGLVYDE